jgi:hypothetical protein
MRSRKFSPASKRLLDLDQRQHLAGFCSGSVAISLKWMRIRNIVTLPVTVRKNGLLELLYLPYSGHMLAMVALSAIDSVATPGPKNSTNLPTTPTCLQKHALSIFFTKMQCRGSGSGIRCLFDPEIRDPGWVKNQDPNLRSGSGTNNPDHISESLETIFWG